MTISDRIAVMRAGKIEQYGAPYEVYEHPRNRFVASFLGKANFFEGKVIGSWENGVELQTSFGGLRMAAEKPAAIGTGALYAVRPEKMRIFQDETEGFLQGTVKFITYAGNLSTYTVDWNGQLLMVEEQNTAGNTPVQPGQVVWLGWEASACHLLEDEVKV